MLSKIKNWFSKGDSDDKVHLPPHEHAVFVLSYHDVKIAVLSCDNGMWQFKYTEEFKAVENQYTHITGFPDLNKIYQQDRLWPFFQIRIPGLKQPAIQEILENEHIDKENEVQLLKRFGQKTLTNPYELMAV